MYSHHKGCGGEIIEDYSKTYDYDSEQGEETQIPAYRCGVCGEEIYGDMQVE